MCGRAAIVSKELPFVEFLDKALRDRMDTTETSYICWLRVSQDARSSSIADCRHEYIIKSKVYCTKEIALQSNAG